MAWYNWAPYVPVAERRRRAKRKMESLRKRGINIQPIEIQGRTIAKTFWGQAWCDHLANFSDFENRLPRGRTYVRNGSVCHLAITRGNVDAKVSGSEIYNLRIRIKTLKPKVWQAVKARCAGQIGSLLELLQGNLSDNVMAVVTDHQNGLFPLRDEIQFNCNCPDWAIMCKHVAAVLYGIGARLDEKPELLFRLRGVNHEELIDTDAEAAVSAATRRGKSKRLVTNDLADVFGIQIETSPATSESTGSTPTKPRKKEKKKTCSATPKVKKTTKKKPGKISMQKPARKTTKKTPAKKTPAKKTPAKKTPAKKTPAKKKGATKISRTTSAKKAPKKNTPKKKALKKKQPKRSGAKKKTAKVARKTTGKKRSGQKAA